MFPVSKMSFSLLGSLDDVRSQAPKLSYQLAVRFMYFMWFVKMGELACHIKVFFFGRSFGCLTKDA